MKDISYYLDKNDNHFYDFQEHRKVIHMDLVFLEGVYNRIGYSQDVEDIILLMQLVRNIVKCWECTEPRDTAFASALLDEWVSDRLG